MIYTYLYMINDLSENDKSVFAFIRNRIIQTGNAPTLREINEITGRSSPRSASLVIERLIKAGLLKKAGRSYKLVDSRHTLGESIATVDVPLVGRVACGAPMLAVENVETHIPVSTNLAKRGATYFLLRAQGNSMNQAGIEDRDIVLVRMQNIAENGDRVVALINDEATIKQYERTKKTVILRPRSSEPQHKPIVLTDDCEIQGVVVATLPPDLY
jgi:repressor LexA